MYPWYFSFFRCNCCVKWQFQDYLWRKFHPVLHLGCPTWHSHQWYAAGRGGSCVLTASPHLFFSFSLLFAASRDKEPA